MRVTNVGNEPLDTITLSDPEAPSCGGSITLPSTLPLGFVNFSLSGS
jgi:hypothetical protein